MEPSVLIARIAGPLLVLVALGMLLNREHYRTMTREFLDSPSLIYLSGTLAFVVGMVIVMFNNLWVADWRVVITLIGWISLIKGIGRIVFPQAVRRNGEKLLEKPLFIPVGSFFVMALGLYLTIMGQ